MRIAERRYVVNQLLPYYDTINQNQLLSVNDILKYW